MSRASTRLGFEQLEDRSVPGGVHDVLGDSLQFVTPAANAQSAPAAPSRPLSGTGSGAFTDAAGGFFASGNMSHLGRFTHYGTLILTPTADPAVFAISGLTTYEAANGDKLYADLQGTLNVVTGVATGTDTWVGGTGRFANAGGTVDLTAQLLPDGTFTFSLEGDINY